MSEESLPKTTRLFGRGMSTPLPQSDIIWNGTNFPQRVYIHKNEEPLRRGCVDQATLVHRAANGDAGSWEPLVLAHQEAVFRLCYLLLGDPDEAEDVAQETFLRAWNHLQRFDPARPLRPWLLSIASNLASNRRRSAGRHVAALMRAFRNEPAPSDRTSIEEKSARQMEASELWRAVQSLSVPDQQIVYLRYFLELSVTETAQALNVAEGTVKSRLSRALEKLRGIIRKDFPVLAIEREGRDI